MRACFFQNSDLSRQIRHLQELRRHLKAGEASSNLEGTFVMPLFEWDQQHLPKIDNNWYKTVEHLHKTCHIALTKFT